MKRFGLIGYPLSHSFSQKFFTEKFEREGIEDCVYENFPIADIEEIKHLIKEHPDLCGLNVTIPYKEKIIPYLDDRSEVVKDTGACNCISISDGKMYGHNTDVTGFRISLTSEMRSTPAKALILGKGGAAMAVAYVLKVLGIDFLHVVRREDKEANTILYGEVNESLLKDHTLIINTTPLGMYPNVHEYPPIPYQFITPDHYLFDLIYNPVKTLFLSKGEERGATIKNGADMLVLQAEESWEIWNKEKDR